MTRKLGRTPRNGWISSTSVLLAFLVVLIVLMLTRRAPSISLMNLSASFSYDMYEATPDSLFHAWEHGNESCSDWIETQRANNAYLDAYVVGSQKAGTTQLTHMLEALKVRRTKMIKEWHFYNHLTEHGKIVFGRFETDGLPPLDDLHKLRLMHVQLGFPKLNITELPPIDNSVIEDRTILFDSTVEYLHNERAAMLASKLTPTSKIIIMIRDPPLRALSQYNMLRRNNNRKLRAQGMSDRPASAEEFDEKVRAEIDVLRKCGYDDIKAELKAGKNTTRLIHCMRMHRPRIDDVMYVMRGLYALFIPAWRKHFPDHHIMYVPFTDLARGYPDAYQRITKFLCIRPFTEKILASVDSGGSDLSHGARAARDGLKKVGPDSYHGNDRYLPNMLPSTKRMLDIFYAPANRKLERMIGRPMF